ncbi:hypothetical protein AB0C77_38335, partial [Streptomyces sp. NPDC048629]
MHWPIDEPEGGSVPLRPHPPTPVGEPGVPDPARVDPLVLGALLDRHGWRRRGGAAGRYARWTPPGPGAHG